MDGNANGNETDSHSQSHWRRPTRGSGDGGVSSQLPHRLARNGIEIIKEKEVWQST